MKRSLLLLLSCGLLVFFVTTAFADSSVRGNLVKVAGNTLTVIDKEKSTTKVRITTATVAVSRESKGKIDPHRILPGSKVNITIHNGDAVVLVLEEEPK